MKKLFITLFCLVVGFQLFAQNCYWVFFTDKNNTTFDPYEYFDAKAIERYHQNHADLYDASNYPVNADYKDQVNALTEEYVGESRWLNALAVMATEEQISAVQSLSFVKGTRMIASQAVLTQVPQTSSIQQNIHYDAALNQVALMQGEKFQQNKLNGKGVRIAVFDGGFPDVDTHPAFKHLRDNHQIVKTWNFATKKENVYGYNAHGRMVLSCIAGIMNDTTLLGLAPGAEFLLARTEVESEKKKEEVWWVQALEWADQNGASIVSSSLGYGQDLHDTKDMDGKTTIVAKGAAMAASKGILVCTAMGNEGGNSWKVLVTPADVDGVLSVGAVRSLEQREYYSSFGPTADGRRKPNVVACGYDMVALKNGNYDYAQGTSFATPMVSGFAACVKQLHPEWTAIQLLQEIEKSANHYPYYDYAYGYGVPQAGYFVNEPQEAKHAFDLQEDENFIYVIPVKMDELHTLFYNVQNGDGSIEYYRTMEISNNDEYQKVAAITRPAFFISINQLKNGQTVNIWYDNQYAKYVVGKDRLAVKDNTVIADSMYNNSLLWTTGTVFSSNRYITHKSRDKYSCRLVLNASFMLPSMITPAGNIHQTDRISRSFSFSFVNNWQLTKVYGLGFRWGFGSSWYAMQNDYYLGSAPEQFLQGDVNKHNLKTSQFDVELYQRFILANLTGTKCYLETGIYGDWVTGSRMKTRKIFEGEKNTWIAKRYYRDGLNKVDCGVRVRLGFNNICAIYGQYRITSLLKQGCDLPKWEIGIQIF